MEELEGTSWRHWQGLEGYFMVELNDVCRDWNGTSWRDWMMFAGIERYLMEGLDDV